MTSIINDERNEFSIDFKHFQRFFIWAWPTDGRTDRASYRGAVTHLKVILVYFWIVSSDFCFNRAQPTNQPTDRPTDRASYRGAMTHLKTKLRSNANATHESFAPVLRVYDNIHSPTANDKGWLFCLSPFFAKSQTIFKNRFEISKAKSIRQMGEHDHTVLLLRSKRGFLSII